MLYAKCDGLKCLAKPKRRGTCPYCNSEVRSKCGTRYIWHWAHISKAECDKWWEGETDWHREWKSYFPIECQEVIHHDLETNEKHVADVKTVNDTVIEFQNSSLSIEELKAREAFYGKMFWIVNGAPFKDSFIVGDKMPSPNARMMKHIRIEASNTSLRYFVWRLSRNPDPGAEDFRDVDPYGDLHIKQAIEQKYDGHRLFLWQRPRTTWYHAEKPVVFDFGETGLFRMLKYPMHAFFVVKQIAKDELILKNCGNPHKDASGQQMGAT
jgi:competence protein CoiA